MTEWILLKYDRFQRHHSHTSPSCHWHKFLIKRSVQVELFGLCIQTILMCAADDSVTSLIQHYCVKDVERNPLGNDIFFVSFHSTTKC